MRTSSRSPSAGQCVPENGKVLGISSSLVLYLSITNAIPTYSTTPANLMPKGIFLQNLAPTLGRRWNSWHSMVCELHTIRDEEAALIMVCQPLQGQQVSPYNRGGSEYAYVRISLPGLRSAVCHTPEPRRAQRCAGQVPPLSGDERCAGPLLFCRSDFEKKLVSCRANVRPVDAQAIQPRGIAAGVHREGPCTPRGSLSR